MAILERLGQRLPRKTKRRKVGLVGDHDSRDINRASPELEYCSVDGSITQFNHIRFFRCVLMLSKRSTKRCRVWIVRSNFSISSPILLTTRAENSPERHGHIFNVSLIGNTRRIISYLLDVAVHIGREIS